MKFLLVSFVWLVSAALAFIPARIAWKKHRSFVSWWVFGFILLIPAIIAALIVSDRSFKQLAEKAWGENWNEILIQQRMEPTVAGWYVNREYISTLEWWDGSNWTSSWLRVDGVSVPERPRAGFDPWPRTQKLIGDVWKSQESDLAMSARLA